MLTAVLHENLALNDTWGVHYLNHLLDDLSLEFEATHVSVVSHHCQDVSYDN